MLGELALLGTATVAFLVGYIFGHAAGRSSGKVEALEQEHGIGGGDSDA